MENKNGEKGGGVLLTPLEIELDKYTEKIISVEKKS